MAWSLYVEMSGTKAADTAMQQAVAAGARGIVMRGTPFFSSAQRKMIVDSAARHRLAVIYGSREYIEQGGLVSYATDVFDLYRLATDYVARILAGTNPGDLPIQQPTKFELIINLKSAKTLGLDVRLRCSPAPTRCSSRPRRYSTLMPAALTTSGQRFNSPLMKWSNCCGVPPMILPACGPVIAARTAGTCRT